MMLLLPLSRELQVYVLLALLESKDMVAGAEGLHAPAAAFNDLDCRSESWF